MSSRNEYAAWQSFWARNVFSSCENALARRSCSPSYLRCFKPRLSSRNVCSLVTTATRIVIGTDCCRQEHDFSDRLTPRCYCGTYQYQRYSKVSACLTHLIDSTASLFSGLGLESSTVDSTDICAPRGAGGRYFKESSSTISSTTILHAQISTYPSWSSCGVHLCIRRWHCIRKSM